MSQTIVNNEKKPDSLSRRHLLKSMGRLGFMSVIASSGLLMPRSLQALTLSTRIGSSRHSLIQTPELSLSLYNTHTGEQLKNHVFWTEGRFIEEQLRVINHFFRDHRTGDSYPIDPDLLKLLVKISKAVETKTPIHLISGYRSSKTNKNLQSKGTGVAKNSQHLYGKAADIVIPGRSLKQIQLAAQSLKLGGVGQYPAFIHVDTGRVRSWGALVSKT